MILPASCTGSHRKKGSTPASGALVSNAPITSSRPAAER